jgi:hypothetical protein
LRWTCKSLRRLAAELATRGHRVSHTVVGELLRRQKFSLQANRKTREGDRHPDRDAQFAYINAKVGAARAEDQAVISVDTKKKELVGDFKNAGREWRRQGQPEEVRVHGLPDQGTRPGGSPWRLRSRQQCRLGERRRHPRHGGLRGPDDPPRVGGIGRARHRDATRLVITADGGGSNGYCVRLWKRELHRLADEIGIAIEAHHLPPGTSQWNKACPREGGDRAPSVLVHVTKLAG